MRASSRGLCCLCDPTAAVESFRKAIELFEAYAPAHYQMGLALQRLNRVEEARKAFARARQLNPSLVPPPEKLKDFSSPQ